MSGASPNISLNSFSYAKFYDGLALQMGVPVLDSDWNELSDIRRVQTIVNNIATVGSTKLASDYTGALPYGFDIYQATSPTNDFGLRAGWAMVEGVLVPTTSASPPAAFNYSNQVMFTGTISTVGGPATYITDSSKAFLSSHNLVGCRLKATSGPAIGLYFVITALASSTQLTFASTGALAAGNTYEIYPPSLTTPGSDRRDEVYIQVWFDDINDVEDPSIVNPGVAVETCHRVKRTWCVRVNEGGTTPANSDANIYGFGTRYLTIGHIDRFGGDSGIYTEMVTNNDGAHSLSSLCAKNVYFDPTDAVSHGFMPNTAVDLERAIDNMVDYLASSSATKGAYLVGAKAVSGTSDSLTVGTVSSQLTELSAQVNNRVRNPNQNTAAMLAASGPQLVWRSHNVSSNSSVTKDTISWYVTQNTTIGAGGAIIIVCGGYLSGSLCYKAPSGTAPVSVSMTMFSTGSTYFFLKTSISSPWAWDSISTWEKYSGFGPTLALNNTPLSLDNEDVHLNTSKIRLNNLNSYIRPISVSSPRRVISQDLSTSPGTTSLPAIWQTANATYITQNCYWNSTLSLWFAHNTALTASAISVSSDGLTVYTKVTDDNMGAGWPETAVGVSGDKWTSSFNIGNNHFSGFFTPNRPSAVMSAEGANAEIIMFAHVFRASMPGSNTYTISLPINFRCRRSTAPTVLIVKEIAVGITDAGTYYPNAYYPEWGGYLGFVSNSSAENALIAIAGHLVIYN